jgi:cytochrome c-type biogenesis protein
MTPLDPLFLIPAAFLAGVLMFLAPCTLPLVPAYLAFIAGGGNDRKKILANAVAYVLGFSVIFIFLGLFAGYIGALLGPWQHIIVRVAGAIIILFGVTMLGVLRIPFLNTEKHIRLPKFLTLGHPQSSFLIGVLFALGWSPCIGPILGTILLFASTSATALQGAILLAVFSFGLGLPFLLTALLVTQAGDSFAKFARFAKILSFVGGLVLIFLGYLMLTNQMGLLITWGFSFLRGPYELLLQYM